MSKEDPTKAFEDLETTYMFIKSSIDHREEPLTQLGELSDFLERVIADPTWLEQDEKFQTFFYEDVTHGVLKRLSRERSSDNEYLAAIWKVLDQFTRLHAKLVASDNLSLADGIKYIFDPICSLHAYHYEDEDLEQKLMEKKKAEQWRHDLKEGDMVDAVKGDFRCKAWGRAKIVQAT